MSEIILGVSPENHHSLESVSRDNAGRAIWRRANAAIKRLFDLAVAIILLVLLSPALLLISLAITLDTPGPVIYRGKRAGKDNRVFHIFKFRTMHECTESYQGPKITAQDDPRITRMGRWLRDTKLNELPQLWNVVRGDMSFVGPRPEDPDIVKEWPEEARREILSVRPGITSPASVVYHDEESRLLTDSLMDEYMQAILPSKLRLDQLYVRRCSLLSDIDNMLQTGMILLPILKDKPIPEHLLYWGLLSRFVSRNLFWFLIDYLIVLISTGLMGVAWRLSGPLNLGLGWAVVIALLIALIFSLFNALFGLHRVDWSFAKDTFVIPLGLSTLLTSLILMLVNSIVLALPLLPQGMLQMTSLLAFLGFVTVRYRERLFAQLFSGWFALREDTQLDLGERALVVSEPTIDGSTTWQLQAFQRISGFHIVGLVNDNPRQQGLVLNGLEVLGTLCDLPDLIDRNGITIVLIAGKVDDSLDYHHIASLCKDRDVRVEIIPEGSGHSIFKGIFNASPRPVPDDLSWVAAEALGRWVYELECLAEAKDWAAVGIGIKDMKSLMTQPTGVDGQPWQQPRKDAKQSI
jgi:lipopolysaccharide/colanic/teichoic acid biosynthesis glycosyltransferase